MIIGIIAFMIFLALLLTLWEIQIEGKNGWAAKLPGWRVEKGWLVKLAGGRSITGYHVFYDAVPDCYSPSAVVFYSLELTVRMFDARLLCRYGFYRRFPMICFKSKLWD